LLLVIELLALKIEAAVSLTEAPEVGTKILDLLGGESVTWFSSLES